MASELQHIVTASMKTQGSKNQNWEDTSTFKTKSEPRAIEEKNTTYLSQPIDLCCYPEQ